MKKQFTELIGVFSALVFLILLTPTNLSAQCEAGETEYTVSLFVGGSFAGERGVEVVPANGDPAFFLVDCGSYPTTPTGEYVDFDFCVVIGEEYTINFRDDFGDSWNMADDPAPWIVSNGPIQVGSGGNPDNGTCCNVGAACGDADIEASFTFTAAEPADCSVPDIDFDVVENCETNTFDIVGTINSYGVNDNGIPVFALDILLESDNPDFELSDIVIPPGLEGQTVDIVLGAPFGTNVTVTPAVGFGSICNIPVELTNDNICPPPNDECTEAFNAECGIEYTGNTANAADLPPALAGTSCGTSINAGGVWYEFTAPFNAIITANTFGSNYDTKLFAFSSDDCVAFECIAGNDDSGGLQSQISFGVNAGETVYFLVSGFFSATGDYSFTVNCEELLCTNPTIAFEAQDLDGNPLVDCQEVGEQYQLAITLNDVPVDDPNADYTVTAGGLTEAAAVVGQEFILGPYNAGTNVTINAVGNQDDLCGSSESYTSSICPPPNNTPCEATVIECAGTYFGTNIGADPAAEGDFCDFSSISGMVYYQFTNPEPNNLIFRWETCNEGTDFDTDSHLFDGPCDALSCRPLSGQVPGGFNVGYNDGDFGCTFAAFATGAEVILAPGETVFLGIDGFSSQSGVFELTVECESILCTSPSLTASAVEVGTDNEIVDCQEVGDEYEIQVTLTGGSGNDDYTLSVGGESIPDAVADVVYTFGPFSAGSTQNVAATGNTEPNCSASGSEGTSICPPPNATCATAIALNCNETVLGTNLGADPIDDALTCSFGGDNGGTVWYTLTLDSDAEVNLNTCLPGTNFDTDLIVYTGDCEALVCSDDFPNGNGGGYIDGPFGCDQASSSFAAQAGFTASAGVTYYIRVSGFGTLSQGVFELEVTCQDIACSPTATATAVADSEGTPLDGCLDQLGEYWVQVDLTGGSDQNYNVSVNGGAPSVAGFEGSVVVGPVGALEDANIFVEGVDNPLCIAEASTSVTDICPPSNDLPCDAIPLVVDGSITQGPFSNENATADDGEVAPPNGTCAGTQDNPAWCDGFGGGGDFGTLNNTIWFTVVVPPSGYMEIDMCNEGASFDNQLAVWRITECGDYASYELVGANDDRPFGTFEGCDFGAFRSGIRICAEPGELLYLQVDGYNGAIGNSVFRITELEENAICLCEAPTIDPDFLLAESFPICDDPENLSYGVIWAAPADLGSSEALIYEYSWPSLVGDPLTVEVPAGTEITTFDNVPLGETISVSVSYSDPNCADLNPFLSGFFGQPADGCAEDCEGVAGGDAVPGTACTTDLEEPGIYNDNCECIATPANDLPCNAEVLECGVQVSGSNTAASTSTDLCDFGASSGPAVFYQYTAEGNGTATLATCLDGTDFDTDSHVFTGTCDDLTCYSEYGGGGYVDGDSGCEFQAWATGGEFPIEEGVTYFIMIDGFAGATGNFELLLTCEFDDEISLDGSLEWDADCGDRPGTVEIYEAGTNNLLNSYDITVDAQGAFSTAITETGLVDVYVKVDGYLADVVEGVELVSGSNVVTLGAPTPGDMNGNNQVGIADFSQFSATYGLMMGDVGYNGLADYNCNMEIDIPDFSSFSANYGEEGAAPVE